MYDVLSGVRVLEFAAWTFVPACCAILADWGADVIKVEPPNGGDPQRAKFDEEVKDQPVNVMLDLPNRNKRSIALDMRSPGGREVFERLVREADVVVTSYLVETRRKLGLDYESLRRINPKIILAAGSGQGNLGPEAGLGGYDLCSAWARSGMCNHLTGSASEPPPFPPAMLDLMSGFALASGVAGALFKRERTGQGSQVDASLLSTGMWMMAPNIMAASYGTEFLPTAGRLDPPISPLVNSYRSKDGRWIYLVLLQSERYWDDLCTRLDEPALMRDPRFQTVQDRIDNKVAAVKELDRAFARYTMDELNVRLGGMPGPWSLVQNCEEVLRDPQVLANGYVAWTEGSDRRAIVAGPVQFDQKPLTSPRIAPRFAEHTDEVLAQAGYGADDIAGLRSAKAVA